MQRKVGDNSQDNLAVYSDGGMSCFACGYTRATEEYKLSKGYIKEKYEVIQLAGEFNLEMWSKLKETSTTKTKGFRGFTEETCVKFGVRQSFDEVTGQVDKQFYPITKNNELCGVKFRVVADKKFYNKGSAGSDCDLFGQTTFNVTGSKSVVLASGECDAMAIYQMISTYTKTKGWEDTPVVSSITGEGGYRQYQNQYEWLNKFDKIIVCPDQDEAGQNHLHKLVQVLPRDKVFVIDLPLKDANEMLVKGKEREFVGLYYKARSYTPSGIVGSDILYEALLEGIAKTKIPLPPFLSTLQDMLRGGIRLPSIVNIVGPTGIGKSTYVNELVYYWIYNSPYMLGILSLEADKAEYSNVIASRHLGVKLNLLQDDEAGAYLRTEDIRDKLTSNGGLFKKEDGSPRFYLMEERDGKLENIKKLIEQLIIACGCKIIILDPIQDLLSGLSISDQEEFSSWLKITIKAYGVCFVCINHIRKPSNGGVDANYSESEVKGSSSIIQSSFLTILLNRDKEPDSELNENEKKVLMSTMTHRISKNRATGLTGDAGSLFYDNTSHTLYDLEEYKTINPDLFQKEVSDLTY